MLAERCWTSAWCHLRCYCCCIACLPTHTQEARTNAQATCSIQMCISSAMATWHYMGGLPPACRQQQRQTARDQTSKQASPNQGRLLQDGGCECAARLQSDVDHACAQSQLLPGPACLLASNLGTRWALNFGSTFGPRCQSQSGTNIEGTYCGFLRSWCHKLPSIIGPDLGPTCMGFLKQGARGQFDPPLLRLCNSARARAQRRHTAA